MRPTRGERLRLGIFTLCGVALAIAAISTMIGFRGFNPGKIYTMRFPHSVGGLTESSRVRVNGVPAGRVRSIELDLEDIGIVEVEVEVDREVPIKVDATASMASQGITGLQSIDIRPGTKGAAELPEGSEIPVKRSPMQQLLSGESGAIGRGEEILENVAEVSKALRGDPEHPEAVPPGMVGDLTVLMRQLAALTEQLKLVLEDNRESIGQTMEGVAGVSGRLDDEVERNGAALHRTLVQAQGTLQTTKQTLEGARVREIAAELEATLKVLRTRLESEDVGEGVKELRAALVELTGLLRRVNSLVAGSEQDVRVILANLRDTSENLAIFSRTIRDDPSSLLTGPKLEGRAP